MARVASSSAFASAHEASKGRGEATISRERGDGGGEGGAGRTGGGGGAGGAGGEGAGADIFVRRCNAPGGTYTYVSRGRWRDIGWVKDTGS